MDAATKTVLVVEDQPDNRRIIRDMLAPTDYEIMEAESGEEALEAIAKQQPDLILMDIQLPEISGLEVTKWLKQDEKLRSIPVVAVTAFAMKGDAELMQQGGCEGYLSKPISIAGFLETVRRFLG